MGFRMPISLSDQDNDERHWWIFGFGSLIWRPDLPGKIIEKVPAYVDGWERRFWQESTDHRGTPDAPGRVATIIPSPHGRCYGMAYQIDGRDRKAVLDYLDEREKDGYTRVLMKCWRIEDETCCTTHGWVYLAREDSERLVRNQLQQSLAVTSAVIARARGPSGDNQTYLFRLKQALDAMGVADAYVDALVQAVECHHGGLSGG